MLASALRAIQPRMLRGVKYLLEKGADPDLSMSIPMNGTPAALARGFGFAAVVEELERASARLAATRRQADSSAAVQRGREALAREAEEELLAELEAEEAEASAKRKVQKESKKG